MRIALVVQRYGLEVVGGAELHCRWVAEHLAERHQVEVLTTTATDYLTWANEYASGPCEVNGISVRRFPVERPRRSEVIDDLAGRVCFGPHTDEEERRWMDEHGPYCPALLDHLRGEEGRFDAIVFFSYRYWTTHHGLRIAPGKSLLVPTAEHDPVVYLRLFRETFRRPAAIVYNSPEERDLIHKVSGNESVPGDVVGTGIDRPASVPVDEVGSRLDLLGDYVIYVGRIERAKGCALMVDHFLEYQRDRRSGVTLALLGRNVMDLAENVHLRLLGVTTEAEKLAALAGARALLMPSRYESLSMVLLEAWMMRRPVMVNGECEVLRGQVLRSGGGLYYRSYEEFAEAMDLLLGRPELGDRLGAQGHAYFEANYSWPTIMAKYDRLLAGVAAPARA
ncbi:MAG: glycosyltransferase family 4 protein [Acidobacteria bacterium]|nr:glycosyltransferase family 4 protein [Acidobacteriota bacterium]